VSKPAAPRWLRELGPKRLGPAGPLRLGSRRPDSTGEDQHGRLAGASRSMYRCGVPESDSSDGVDDPSTGSDQAHCRIPCRTSPRTPLTSPPPGRNATTFARQKGSSGVPPCPRASNGQPTDHHDLPPRLLTIAGSEQYGRKPLAELRGWHFPDGWPVASCASTEAHVLRATEVRRPGTLSDPRVTRAVRLCARYQSRPLCLSSNPLAIVSRPHRLGVRVLDRAIHR
jgi:hypothetical protein